MCENYLISSHKVDIIKILENPDKEKYFSLNINFLELFESDTNLGNALLTDPEVSLKTWNEAVYNVQTNFLKEPNNNYTIKNNVNCRIHNLPPWPHVCRTIFPGNDDANKFLQVTGTVVRMSARKLLEYQRQYICTKCKYPITVDATYDKRNIIKQPSNCPNPDGCTGKNIVSFGELNTYNCKDYQEIKIQEDLSKLGVGTVPNHMIVTLEDDLVNTCKPGENVTITGIVVRRWSEFDKGAKIAVDIVLKANHVQVNNSSGFAIAVSGQTQLFFDNFWKSHVNDPLVGRNVILRSIAPEIYGLHLVKLAIAIVLAGGSQNENHDTPTGIDTRSESHLLFVGDPGTGKSQMLRFASKIVPRSVLTTGVGSTAAGLTVTAIMENGEWQLEAGALVMADGGICCIDEFNSMKEHDRTSIHEAMEQQTISVAKAGMVCKLKTRCTILAACNPKGNINTSQPLCLNVAMSSPLLSRFDLILLLRDLVNEENDRTLAEYLLSNSSQSSNDGSLWSLEKLQAYYAVIKKRVPKLTNDAETILSTYYQLQRKFGNRNKSRTTVRLLESLIRLSQGHAKLMYHSEVQVLDAIFAVMLTDCAMDRDSSILDLRFTNDAFCDSPAEQYGGVLESILGKLNLDYIYQREIEKNSGDVQKGLFSQSSAKPSRGLFTQKRQQACEEKRGETETRQLPSQSTGGGPQNRTLRNITNASFSQQFSDTKDSGNYSDLDRPSTSGKTAKPMNLSQKVWLNSELDSELDMDLGFDNLGSNHDGGAKKAPKLWSFKKNVEPEAGLSKLKSVNDDFLNKKIDWDMEEDISCNCPPSASEEVGKLSTGSKRPSDFKEKQLKKRHIDCDDENEKSKCVSNKEVTKPSRLSVNLLSKFGFQPRDTRTSDITNTEVEHPLVSNKTAENSSPNSDTKLNFQRLNSKMDFSSTLDDEIDSLETSSLLNSSEKFSWKKNIDLNSKTHSKEDDKKPAKLDDAFQKHEAFDMSQDSKKVFIKKKFVFKRPDAKILPRSGFGE